ncbi:coiled-coil domain-containing protein 77-like isoform X1 [Portunus trituberculatus]|uniref:coiled-coil domain-containing protein 77-like isoform X1 n=1 Tax=Portunus trituberculatus TaxID=210409 RepID=UPI001E1D1189|nr:coiled-coil domain-containing protein 77-like isoform X1 [Portunus trituberculatus]
MAATDRLRSSLKKRNNFSVNRRSIDASKNAEPETCVSKRIDVNEELEKLQPSQRLLDFYREKITKIETEHQRMWDLVEKYRKVSRPTFDEGERQDMTRELIELRSALSDINVFLHAERQQVSRLHAENERLQLANLEAEKKVSMLLTLSGLTEGELKVFLRDARRTTIVKQRLPPHLRMLYSKLREELPKPTPGHPEESDEELVLKAEITSLKKQLQESEKNWRREKDALLQDRTLVASENKLQVSKDEAHINLLTARLEESQNLVTEAIQDSLKSKSKMQDVEMKWLAEKDHLLSILASMEENMSLVSHLEAIGRSGSYTDLTKTKSTCELKDLRRENDLLKTEAAEAEDLRVVYEAQCLQMEQRMCKLREEKEANEQTFKEQNQKLRKQIEMLKDQNMKLDERRKTDTQGFQSSIRLLKDDMKTVVHQMYKLTMAFSGDTIPVDFTVLNEMQAVATLVRAVQNTISEARRRALRGECDLVCAGEL